MPTARNQSGGYTDHTTGLVLFGLRYYDSVSGRWVNRDLIGYAGGMNLHAYADGDPINNSDSSGLAGTGLGLVGAELAQWTHNASVFTGISEAGLGTTAAVGTSSASTIAATGSVSLAAPAAVIAGGAAAVADLTIYATTGKARGPFTQLGERIGNALFPIDTGYDFSCVEDFFAGSPYSPKVMRQIEYRKSTNGDVDWLGDYHAFPESVTGFQASGTISAKVSPGSGKLSLWLEIPGSYRGREGVFEFIKNITSEINHRKFKPD